MAAKRFMPVLSQVSPCSADLIENVGHIIGSVTLVLGLAVAKASVRRCLQNVQTKGGRYVVVMERHTTMTAKE